MTTQQVKAKVEAFFLPALRVQFRRGRISPDSVNDFRLWRQFCKEAGLSSALHQPEANYDAILAAASAHGYSLEYEIP